VLDKHSTELIFLDEDLDPVDAEPGLATLELLVEPSSEYTDGNFSSGLQNG
jgi:hypothetical protein